jgi:YVTN family beta-propeller protein
VGREPEGVRLAPNGQWLLVTSENDNSVAIIDPATYRILATVLVGVRPRDVAFTADSSAAFVQGEQDGSLYRIALPSGAPATQVLQMRKEARPMGLLMDIPRGRLYVTTGRGGTLAVVSAKDGTLTQEIPVGARPWGIAMTPDRRQLITANGRSNDITFVNADTLAVTGKLAVGQGPWGVVTGP